MIPKRNKVKIVIFLLIFLLILNAVFGIFRRNILKVGIEKTIKKNMNIQSKSGTVYYVSSSGNSQDGTDINQPMSLETAKSKTYKTGDTILFKCGDVFFGQLDFNISKTNDEIVLISSYGRGDKPIISVAKIISDKNSWKKYNENIYMVDLTNTNDFEGINSIDEDSCNIGFFTTENGDIYGQKRTSINSLKNINDFYCDGKYFYIMSYENPKDILGTIKLSTKKNIILLSSNLEISNLSLQYSSSHAIMQNKRTLEKIYIHDCIIDYIGGSFQYGINSNNSTRYGNGIELWNGSRNTIIKNNLIKNVYDAGITLQGDYGKWSNIYISENIIVNTCYPFELWSDQYAEGMNNIEICDNMIINQGNGWGQYVRINPLVSANIVIYNFSENSEMNIRLCKNRYYNSRRLYYISEQMKKRFFKEVYNDNNVYFVDEDTYIINNSTSTDIKEYLNSNYEIDLDSSFNYLFDSEIEEISNEEILNSDNYDEIKAYYDNFDIKYRNSHWGQDITSSIDEIMNEDEYNSLIENSNINTSYTDLKNAIGKLSQNVDTITQDSVSYSYECLYNFISTIVNEYNNNNISIEENILLELIEKLDNISDKYKEIYSYYITEDSIELDTVKNDLNNTIDKYNNNLDLDIGSLENIIIKIRDLYNNSITTDNVYENVLNKNRIIYITNIVNSIIDSKINDFVAEEKGKIQVEFDRDIYEPTNENITVTLITGDSTKITNNEGSNKHTFYENGKFTFELDIKGVKVSVEVTIANINKDYTIEDGYISNISNNTLANTLKEELNLNNYTILHNGNELDLSKAVISTGDILKYDNKEYTLIVSGDVDKDGDCGIRDLVSLRKYLLDYTKYDTIEEMAADTNQDDSLDIKDLVGMRKIILN